MMGSLGDERESGRRGGREREDMKERVGGGRGRKDRKGKGGWWEGEERRGKGGWWEGADHFSFSLPTMTGNKEVTEAMKHFAELTVQAK